MIVIVQTLDSFAENGLVLGDAFSELGNASRFGFNINLGLANGQRETADLEFSPTDLLIKEFDLPLQGLRFFLGMKNAPVEL